SRRREELVRDPGGRLGQRMEAARSFEDAACTARPSAPLGRAGGCDFAGLALISSPLCYLGGGRRSLRGSTSSALSVLLWCCRIAFLAACSHARVRSEWLKPFAASRALLQSIRDVLRSARRDRITFSATSSDGRRYSITASNLRNSARSKI